MMAEDIIVKGKDVTVSFINKIGNRKEKKTVLEGLDFDVQRGEILGLAGESGSGKSTLAKAILGMVPLERGSIESKAENPQMIFQDPYSSLNPAKTISWIMQEPLKLGKKKYTGSERLAKVEERLGEVGLDAGYMQRKPGELSGGQRQRICIGTALMQAPELLIADEPVSALDVTIQAQVLELMREIHRKKKLTILFISHDLRTMYNFCDRVMILQKGRIVECGKPEDIYSDPKEPYTRLLLESAGIV
ncbi:MAG: Oligopeptide transport ATP-binding protein OppF [Firmicutes bacterium ADurb.Bin354]|nr:MAG: Oligopeptide transport ATP-binding protein OppF [Firmicutes bacterium ADurb.Bin354]